MLDLNLVNPIYSEIKNILERSRVSVVRAVNSEMVKTYWSIGRIIVEEEQKGKERAEYGDYLIKYLSQRLTKDFGKGFDISNLKNMRLFYITFKNWYAVSSKSQKGDAVRHQLQKYHAVSDESSKGHTLRSELTWTHYRLLLKLDENPRNFYINEIINNNWSTRELERQINSLLFERLSLSKNKKKVKELAAKGQVISKPEDIIKDPYILEFLGIPENSSFSNNSGE